MSKRQREPIRVEAYVTVDGKEVNVDTLSPERKAQLGTWLKCTYLNALFRGKCVFQAEDSTT